MKDINHLSNLSFCNTHVYTSFIFFNQDIQFTMHVRVSVYLFLVNTFICPATQYELINNNSNM